MELFVDQFSRKFGIPWRGKFEWNSALLQLRQTTQIRKNVRSIKYIPFLRFSVHLNCSVVVRNFIKQRHKKMFSFFSPFHNEMLSERYTSGATGQNR